MRFMLEIKLLLSVYILMAFNHVESLYNSWLSVVIIQNVYFPCITTLASSAYRNVKSNSDTM